MGLMATLVRGGPFTRDDLDAMPDDGHRYELIDGSLIVTPAPSIRHQSVVAELYVLLRGSCPAELKVLFAPVDVVLARDTVMRPDLLVGRRRDLTEKDLPAPPLLAVEVLSPSTRHIDLGLKLARFETAGVASYWVFDPLTPAMTGWELESGRYVRRVEVTGSDGYDLVAPYPMHLVPAELLG